MTTMHFPVVEKPGRLVQRTVVEGASTAWLPIREARGTVDVDESAVLGLLFDGSSSADLLILEGLPDQPVEYIRFDGCTITSQNMLFVWKIRRLAQVDFIDTVLHGGVFSQAYSAEALQSMNILRCHLDDDVFEGFSSIHLRSFTFADAHLTRSRLAFLHGLPSLISLDVGYTDFSDHDAEALSWVKALEELHLDGTRITDKGLRRLESIASLKHVTLFDTAATADGVTLLQAHLPRCKVAFGDGTHLPA